MTDTTNRDRELLGLVHETLDNRPKAIGTAVHRALEAYLSEPIGQHDCYLCDQPDSNLLGAVTFVASLDGWYHDHCAEERLSDHPGWDV